MQCRYLWTETPVSATLCPCQCAVAKPDGSCSMRHEKRFERITNISLTVKVWISSASMLSGFPLQYFGSLSRVFGDLLGTVTVLISFGALEKKKFHAILKLHG